MAGPFTYQGGGLLGDQPWQYLGDLGMGLLAASGPSFQPQGGFGQALGRAGTYASERQGERLMNDTRRMALSQASEQRAAEAKFREALSAGASPEALKSAAAGAYPEILAKSLFPQALDPDTQLRMLEIEQRIKETRAGSDTPSASTARAVGTLADVFDTAEKEGSPFAPGEAFSSSSLLAKAGISAPEVVKGMPDSFLAPFGDPATLKRQAAQALLIDKETATISQNLTQLADKGTGRSATALNNLNTSLGTGNVPIPVRRKVILSTLETVIDDVESRGSPVDPEWYQLRDKLRKQTEGITKGGEEGNVAYGGGAVGQPPAPPPLAVTSPPGFSGIATPPPAAARAAVGPAAPAPLVAPASRPTYRSEVEIQRDFKSGKLVLPPEGIEVLLGGELVRLRPQVQ